MATSKSNDPQKASSNKNTEGNLTPGSPEIPQQKGQRQVPLEEKGIVGRESETFVSIPGQRLPDPSQSIIPPAKPTTDVDQPHKITSYGQLLQLERKVRGWTEDQLAQELGVNVSIVQSWETNLSVPDRAFRPKLAELVGNYYSLSAEVLANGDLQVRVVQIELTAHDFTTIISLITEFYTQLWLLQQGRIDDLAKYTKTQDSRFVKEANLVIDSLVSKSPALITLITDPHNITTAVTTTVTIVVALKSIINEISHAWEKILHIRIETAKNIRDVDKIRDDRKRRAEYQRIKKEEAIEKKKVSDTTIVKLGGIVVDSCPSTDPIICKKAQRLIIPKYRERLPI